MEKSILGIIGIIVGIILFFILHFLFVNLITSEEFLKSLAEKIKNEFSKKVQVGDYYLLTEKKFENSSKKVKVDTIQILEIKKGDVLYQFTQGQKESESISKFYLLYDLQKINYKK
jgi:hypothetical protein